MGIEKLGVAAAAVCLTLGALGLEAGRQASQEVATLLEPAAPDRTPAPRLKAPVPMFKQTTNYTCGPASLQAILSYYGIHIGEMDVAREAGTSSQEGTPPMGLVRAARKYGLKAEVLTGMTINQLKQFLDRRIPVIVDIQAYAKNPAGYAVGWEDGHYVVATGYDAKQIYFMDPSLDKANGYLRPLELLARWHDYEVIRGHRLEFVHAGIPIEGGSAISTAAHHYPFAHID